MKIVVNKNDYFKINCFVFIMRKKFHISVIIKIFFRANNTIYAHFNETADV